MSLRAALSHLWLVLLLALGAGEAHAQIVSERELEITKALFDSGQYAEALKRADNAMSLANFTDAQRVEMQKFAALSAFNLGNLPVATQHFSKLLQLNPDYVLDPFAVPPPAIKQFEQVRREMADSLNLIRQQLALRAEQEKRAEAARVAAEEQRRRLEALNRDITVRTVEKRSWLLNFVPFGAGQFQQGRTGWGLAFAISEAVMGLTSIISFIAIDSLYKTTTYEITDRLTPDGKFSFTIRGIPPENQPAALNWSRVKYGTGLAFYGLWVAGSVDALLHHDSEIVTERREKAPPPIGLQLTPTSGGLNAAFTLSF